MVTPSEKTIAERLAAGKARAQAQLARATGQPIEPSPPETSPATTTSPLFPYPTMTTQPEPTIAERMAAGKARAQARLGTYDAGFDHVA
ncbi:MAG: hypothetical protein R2710_25960 [Acidimicrobiales bacterium]